MADNMYQLVGKVNVPAEKRDEMNKYVLEIMDKCGIRKMEKMTVEGVEVTVVSPVQPNADGIVMFDYSIFEKYEREICTYDLNTCELHAEDRGYREFAVVMNMIMVLQEVYTNGECYFVKSGKLYNIEGYLFLLQGVLGKRITVPGRARMWDCFGSFNKILFYKVIRRKNEDEFLEFWDGHNLVLSQDMKECIQCWKEQFDDISVPSDMVTEYSLAKIIIRLKGFYFRYVDKAFVTEFIENGNDLNHQKALILLERILDEGQEYFPELIGEQADEWIIRRNRSKFDHVAISALLSLLTNKKQRNKIFGF